MDGARPRTKAVAVLVAVMVTALGPVGCGNGSGPVGPTGTPTPSGRTTPTGTDRTGSGPSTTGTASRTHEELARAQFSYSLPEGDYENADGNGIVYGALKGGRCGDAQHYLDLAWATDFMSVDQVVMYQVGADMCTGRTAAAEAMFQRGEQLFGWQGVAATRNVCNIYRAYRSFVDQVPQREVSCPDGDPIRLGHPADDPRTDAVEAFTPPPYEPEVIPTEDTTGTGTTPADVTAGTGDTAGTTGTTGTGTPATGASP